MLATKMFFTKGVGIHRHKLTSFELALRDAGIERFNLVRVSSIFPPNCKIVSKEEGLKELQPGQVVFVVLAEMSSNESSRLMVASIGMALPPEKDKYGYLSEHHAYGETDEKAGDFAEELAATMLASAMGLADPENVKWDELKQEYIVAGKAFKTRNVTQSREVPKDGDWCTVVAAAVLIP